jgi:hypothetical protein
MSNTLSTSAVGKILATATLVVFSQFAAAQTAVLGANSANAAYVYPNVNFPAGSCPASLTANTVSGIPAGSAPHGVGFYGSDFALIASFGQSQIFNVRLSTASTLNVLNTAALGYNGSSTVAIAPSLNYAIAATGSTAYILSAPFSAVTGTTTALPGSIAGFQTQAIAFDTATSRAYIAHSAGISALDPPYSSVLFTIPGSFQSVAITPNNNQLLATSLATTVSIFTGPFSAGSTPAVLTVAGASGLDGIIVSPDGTRALVAVAFANDILVSIAAPFTASSTVDLIALPTGVGSFEDVSISADNLFALVTGNFGDGRLVGVRAPFTTAGATACAFPVTGGRGAGAVRFLPSALQPPAAGPAPVPTLSPWALLLLALVAGSAAFVALRRRQIH